ncbi:MAG: MerR family transcriptional regulator [Verrucomicrobiaceae bacterium]
MSDFILTEQYSTASLKVVEAGVTFYTLDAAAVLAGVHPDLLRYYCRAGLLGEARAQDHEPVFDDDALYELRRIEHYRRHHGVNLRALPLVFDLLREIEQLHAELRLNR